MPRIGQSVPKYRKHKASGQAIVEVNGRRFYLGPHGTKSSRFEYDRLIAKRLASGRSNSYGTPAIQLTVVELIVEYLRHCKTYYGTGPNSEWHRVSDYTIWRDKLGSPNSLSNDDTPGVGQDDFDRWKTHFGKSSGSGMVPSFAAPEPSTMVLLMSTTGWCLWRGRAGQRISRSRHSATLSTTHRFLRRLASTVSLGLDEQLFPIRRILFRIGSACFLKERFHDSTGQSKLQDHKLENL